MKATFSIRIRIGESEIELKGSKDDVFDVISLINHLIPIISNSFNLSANIAKQTAVVCAKQTDVVSMASTLPAAPRVWERLASAKKGQKTSLDAIIEKIKKARPRRLMRAPVRLPRDRFSVSVETSESKRLFEEIEERRRRETRARREV